MEGCGVSTSTAMAAIAGSQASIAANQAAQARKAAQCVGVIDGFTHSTASVEQRQEYAECVGLLYPSADAISPAAVGLLLITALLGAIPGAFFGARSDGLIGMAVMGSIWALMFPLVAILVWGIWQAIKYALGVTG